ncbi:beta-lactamase/transpeptidase-like protein [Aspergillus karnatakaensis]|uniref:serine hydrolase domain-containing protein n=1 Tax=Aspergillus karnatakaensis TaxID=1810916 RepID=UPI003CCCA3D2
MATVQVHGHCDPRFSSLRDTLSSRLNSSLELGASMCVTVHGKTLVDIHGGYKTPARTEPWTATTLAPVWSVSKTISALSVLLLIDRNQLTPDTPLADFWPAFNTDDKRSILVRHVLSHTSGLPAWDPPITEDELFNNTQSATEKLVSQRPWWEPGTASGYHLVSQGILLNEIVHRVSGKTMAQFIQDEFATPLNAEFYLGLQDESQWPRIAELLAPPPMDFKGAAAGVKSGSGSGKPLPLPLRAMIGVPMRAESPQTPGFRKAGLGSMGGFSNAKGFNKILEIVTNRGTVVGPDGKVIQFLKPETVDLIFDVQADGTDLVLGMPLRMGLGFGLSNGSLDWIPQGRVAFWGGWGGSLAVLDLDRGVTFTYAMNRMENGTLGNSSAEAYGRELYRILKEEEKANL